MRDRKVASFLVIAIEALSLVLMLVLAGSAALVLRDRVPKWVEGFGNIFGGLGAGLAWPVFALLSVALAGALLVAALRPDLRSGRRAFAVVLGAAAWIAAVVEGVRPPTSRTGVFTGELVYRTLLHADAFIPCIDPARPLPRGVELGFGRVQDIPLWALVRIPDEGWHGSHPRDWPHTVSNSHGGLYFTLRVRGTLTGPGNYGFPPGFQYRLRIDSILHVAPQHPADDPPCATYRASAAAPPAAHVRPQRAVEARPAG
jgi:hypothetical protein